MDVLSFKAAFLGLFTLGFIVEACLLFLNRSEVVKNRKAPLHLAGLVIPSLDAEAYSKTRSYVLAGLELDSVALVFNSGLTLLILFTGVLLWLDRVLVEFFGHSYTRSVSFLVLVIGIPSLLKLPFSLFSTFRIEGPYGFNTMTWGLFWKDYFKGSFVSLAFGIPVLYGIFIFMDHAGTNWWLLVFAFIVFIQVIMMVVYPVLIAPIFNRFQPLPEGEAKAAILDLAKRLRFPSGGIYQMDGSRRSLHSNAYFTGIGRWRRIVIFDTLLRQMDIPELVAILAHEIGHYKRGHILKLMALQMVSLVTLLYLASLAFGWPPLFQAFGFPGLEVNPAVGLFLFMAVFSAFSILYSPVLNWVSRRHEFDADAFATKACGESESLVSALVKLSQKNLSNLAPHPWYSAFHYSHPTLFERVKALTKQVVT